MEQNEKITLQKLKKEMEAMREEYEKRLAGVATSAEDVKRTKVPADTDEMLKEQEAWLNEYVEIKLFKDNDRYKDDVYVAINGKNCVIRRGEWTRIRRKFAMLLDQSEIQDLRTAELIAGESEKFRCASRAMGM
jgi:hypothetical protein